METETAPAFFLALLWAVVSPSTPSTDVFNVLDARRSVSVLSLGQVLPHTSTATVVSNPAKARGPHDPPSRHVFRAAASPPVRVSHTSGRSEYSGTHIILRFALQNRKLFRACRRQDLPNSHCIANDDTDSPSRNSRKNAGAASVSTEESFTR